MRRLVFIGNCQVQVIFNLYRIFVEQSRNEILHYVKSYEDLLETDIQAISAADCLIQQVQDFKPKADGESVGGKADRIGVPVVHCGFLWPFAGQPHPCNPTPTFLTGGPYGFEMNDAYLNRLLKRGVSADEAVAAYGKLDVNKTVNLDRLHELVLEKQALRDGMTGFAIAPEIAEHFRSEQVFLTPYHPGPRIARSLVSQAFEKLGVPASDIRQMAAAVNVTPFPREELPIHPSVSDHFGLYWAARDRRYRFLREGSYTFDQFARRYMAAEWNSALEEGLFLADQSNWQQAFDRLVTALAISPDAAEGHAALARVREQLGLVADALSSARRAVALDPASPRYRLVLATLLERDTPAAAEAEFREAVSLDPWDAHYWSMLTNHLLRNKRDAEALAAAEAGLANIPRAGSLHCSRGYALGRLGDLPGAEAAYRTAAGWMRAEPEPWLALAELYRDRHDLASAVRVLREGATLHPHAPRVLSALARTLGALGLDDQAVAVWLSLLGKNGLDLPVFLDGITALSDASHWDEAHELARMGLEQFPGSIVLLRQLAHAMSRNGAPAEALGLLDAHAAMLADDADLLTVLGDALAQTGHLDRAELVFRQVVRLAPRSAHAFGRLGGVLSRLGKHDEAITARKIACSVEPANWHRHAQLAHVFLAAGQLSTAEARIRTAIQGAPDHAAFHVDLARILARTGRSSAALESARNAVLHDAADPHAHGFLAYLAEEAGDVAAAERHYREAIALHPYNADWPLRLSRMLETPAPAPADQETALSGSHTGRRTAAGSIEERC